MYRAQSTASIETGVVVKVYKYIERVHERATRGHGGRQLCL